MAKQSDHLVGVLKADIKAEKTGSRSGLFAEENEFDRRALLRIGSWGAVAVGAVTLAVLSNHWSLGLKREQLAATDLARQAQQIQSLAKESQNETRRLASAIETLNNDRDRLFSRVTVIEQGLDSVTGALAKQGAPAAGPQASASPAPQTTATAPVPAPVTTTAAAVPAADKPRDAGKDSGRSEARNDTRSDAKSDPAATAAIAAASAPAATATTQPAAGAAAAGASLMSRSMMAPPDPAAPRLVEAAKSAEGKAAEARVDAKLDARGADIRGGDKESDARVADAAITASTDTAAPTDAAAEPQANVAVKQTEFAVDLGSANSIGGLRALWRSVRHLNGELGALNPIIVIRESRTGLGMQLHLAAGPLKDAAAAAKICAALAETRHGCESTVYDGQRLALKAEEGQPKPASATSDGKADAKAEARPEPPQEGRPTGRAAERRHSWARHSKREEPPPPPVAAEAPAPPPKPPEPTSTFSSLFGRK